MVRVEGAKYRFLTQPVRFIAGADGRLAAVECVELKLGEPDAKGRRKSVPVDGSNFSIAADIVILSKSAPGIGKYIKNKTNDTTLHEGIFTGGHFDAGSNRAVSAIKGEGKTALALDKNLKSKK